MSSYINKSIDFPGGTIRIYSDTTSQNKAQRLIKSCPDILKAAYINGSMEFLGKLKILVQKCIRSGTPPKGAHWPPLSRRYVKEQGAHPIYLLTGQYYRSIQLIRGKGGKMALGLPSNVTKANPPKRSKGRIRPTLVAVARMLENGGGNLPARPLWRPSYRQLAGAGDRLLTKIMVNHIRKQIKIALGGGNIRNARI